MGYASIPRIEVENNLLLMATVKDVWSVDEFERNMIMAHRLVKELTIQALK
jgi:hypothetical protein